VFEMYQKMFIILLCFYVSMLAFAIVKPLAPLVWTCMLFNFISAKWLKFEGFFLLISFILNILLTFRSVFATNGPIKF